VNRLTVRQKYNPQVLPAHLWNLRPSPNTTIGLNDLLRRLLNGALNPILFDDCSIRALPHFFKVPSKLHAEALRDQTLQSSVSASPCRISERVPFPSFATNLEQDRESSEHRDRTGIHAKSTRGRCAKRDHPDRREPGSCVSLRFPEGDSGGRASGFRG
jgi:hypothetical protein